VRQAACMSEMRNAQDIVIVKSVGRDYVGDLWNKCRRIVLLK